MQAGGAGGDRGGADRFHGGRVEGSPQVSRRSWVALENEWEGFVTTRESSTWPFFLPKYQPLNSGRSLVPRRPLRCECTCADGGCVTCEDAWLGPSVPAAVGCF